MPTKQKQTGNRGEALAAMYLQASGYHIIATQWTCPHGEMDIIAQDPSKSTWIFCEVKTRHDSNTDNAFAAITAKKREKLLATAYAFFDEQDLDADDLTWRIDVIAVALPKKADPIIEHVEDALAW